MFGNEKKKTDAQYKKYLDPSKVYPDPIKGIGETTHIEEKQTNKIFVILIISVVLLIFIVIAFVSSNKEDTEKPTSQKQSSYAEEVAGITTDTNLSSIELNKTYDKLLLPNTMDIVDRPMITGDTEIDNYLSKLAEARGYQLRSVPRLPIVKTNSSSSEEEDLLQPLAYQSWLELKKQAVKDGIELELNSGYRSVEWQRGYFKEQLNNEAVALDKILSGSEDEKIDKVMGVVSPPGYSKHHSGYTVDFSCAGNNSFTFEGSPCWDWISRDDFEIAKKYHWTPSYPKGTENTGPNPEPWEFVWFD
ncbi:MAG: D-alanyl-D-alanine carboxypeptidase family protein [bacterium]|nr:D-alanyl-D-alanine carboxypeptidase family protein [bacterium]